MMKISTNLIDDLAKLFGQSSDEAVNLARSSAQKGTAVSNARVLDMLNANFGKSMFKARNVDDLPEALKPLFNQTHEGFVQIDPVKFNELAAKFGKENVSILKTLKLAPSEKARAAAEEARAASILGGEFDSTPVPMSLEKLAENAPASVLTKPGELNPVVLDKKIIGTRGVLVDTPPTPNVQPQRPVKPPLQPPAVVPELPVEEQARKMALDILGKKGQMSNVEQQFYLKNRALVDAKVKEYEAGGQVWEDSVTVPPSREKLTKEQLSAQGVWEKAPERQVIETGPSVPAVEAVAKAVDKTKAMVTGKTAKDSALGRLQNGIEASAPTQPNLNVSAKAEDAKQAKSADNITPVEPADTTPPPATTSAPKDASPPPAAQAQTTPEQTTPNPAKVSTDIPPDTKKTFRQKINDNPKTSLATALGGAAGIYGLVGDWKTDRIKDPLPPPPPGDKNKTTKNAPTEDPNAGFGSGKPGQSFEVGEIPGTAEEAALAELAHSKALRDKLYASSTLVTPSQSSLSSQLPQVSEADLSSGEMSYGGQRVGNYNDSRQPAPPTFLQRLGYGLQSSADYLAGPGVDLQRKQLELERNKPSELERLNLAQMYNKQNEEFEHKNRIALAEKQAQLRDTAYDKKIASDLLDNYGNYKMSIAQENALGKFTPGYKDKTAMEPSEYLKTMFSVLGLRQPSPEQPTR